MKNLRIALKRVIFLLAVLCLAAFYPNSPATSSTSAPTTSGFKRNAIAVYNNLELSNMGLPLTAYSLAISGWEKLKDKGLIHKNVIAICDFTQSSTQKRLYIIDLDEGKLLFNTLVAHGKNTGEEFARYFSNEPSSLKTSLGFYTTMGTYDGQHGLSLKLKGVERGFNDNAEERSIVMHGAEYVCDKFICTEGRLGRSWGCPAVPYNEHEAIINTLKEGSCLFIYYPDKRYLATSKLIK